MASATACPCFSLRPLTTTCAPSQANASAIACPIPDVLPVTRAFFPVSASLPPHCMCVQDWQTLTTGCGEPYARMCCSYGAGNIRPRLDMHRQQPAGCACMHDPVRGLTDFARLLAPLPGYLGQQHLRPATIAHLVTPFGKAGCTFIHASTLSARAVHVRTPVSDLS